MPKRRWIYLTADEVEAVHEALCDYSAGPAFEALDVSEERLETLTKALRSALDKVRDMRETKT